MRDWVGLIAILDILKNRKISCPCKALKPALFSLWTAPAPHPHTKKARERKKNHL